MALVNSISRETKSARRRNVPKRHIKRSHAQERQFSDLWETYYGFSWVFTPSFPREALQFEIMGRAGKRTTLARSLATRKKGSFKADIFAEANKFELESAGFTVFSFGKSSRTYVLEETRQQIADQILDYGTVIVNNSPTGGPGDATRLMLVCQWDNTPGRAAKMVRNILKKAYPYLVEGDCQFLMSVGGGHSQQPHTDAPAGFEKLEDQNVMALHNLIMGTNPKYPLAVIVTFNEPSFLWVWPGSHKTIWLPEECVNVSGVSRAQKVTIPPYSAMVLRQDLVHAGTSYDVDNIRLHFSMEVTDDSYVKPPDSVSLVDETYFVFR